MEPVRWGIAGFGWVARDFMAPAIRRAGDRLAAVADPDAAAAAEARALGATGHATIDALVADPDGRSHLCGDPEPPASRGRRSRGPGREGRAVRKADGRDARRRGGHCVACREAGVLYGTAFDQRHHPAHRVLRAASGMGRSAP